MKSYRSRGISTKCQIAQDDGNGQPLMGADGKPLLDHAGLWFLKVSGNDANDNKRVIPLDHQAFFQLKAKEMEEALKAEGVTDVTVSADDVYADYATMYTKPARTYAPPGKPEEFSIVLPKGLCVNFVGGGIASRTVGKAPVAPPQSTSLFARLKAARQQQQQATGIPVRKAKASA